MKKTSILYAIIFLFYNCLYAQDDQELLKFLHSGTVETEKTIVKVPIKIWNELILLKVKVNGNDATFIWDNGFSVSGIDSSLTKKYKFIPYHINKEISAIDGNNVMVKTGLAVCAEFEIKGIIYNDTPFMKLDIRKFTNTKDLKIQGLIGSSIINKLNWNFNFDKNYVEISEKPFIINDNNLVLPFKIDENSNTHIMPITIEGGTGDCLIDFGYNSDVIQVNTVNAKYFSKASATKAFGSNSISVSGLAALDTIYTIKDNFLWELSGKKLNVNPKMSFTKSTGKVTIGNKFFRDRYNVIINTSGNTRYALWPRKKPVNERTENSHSYKLFNIDGKFKIMSIQSNADTVNRNIKLLDEVISINGKMPADFEDNNSLLMYQKELQDKQKKMVLKFKDGNEIMLIPMPSIEYKFKNDTELWSL